MGNNRTIRRGALPIGDLGAAAAELSRRERAEFARRRDRNKRRNRRQKLARRPQGGPMRQRGLSERAARLVVQAARNAPAADTPKEKRGKVIEAARSRFRAWWLEQPSHRARGELRRELRRMGRSSR